MNGHAFAFGLDHDRRHHANSRPAQQEFDELFIQSGGYREYYHLVETLPHAVPVLQPSTDGDVLLLQLGNADTLNRGLVVHLTRESYVPILNLASSVPPLPQDTIFVVDAGWSRNYELLEQWATSTLGRIVSLVPNAEIVLAASSFPDGFGEIVGHATVNAHEVRLFGAMRQRFNQANLTFGDWGSTRKAQSGGGGRIPARVDIPHGSGWEVFRADTDLEQHYADMAETAMTHSCFERTPDCYGKELIRNTPGKGGITGPARATEARINIHLTLRSDARNTLDTQDADYED